VSDTHNPDLTEGPSAPSAGSLQREITERLLISALHEVEIAERAQTSLTHLEFLVKAAELVGASLNSSVTRDAVAGVTLPILGTWSIVDLVESDGAITRLPMIHPDPRKQILLRELARDWQPEPADPLGVPAVQTDMMPHLIEHDVDAALQQAAHSQNNLQLLREMHIGALLTIPMLSRDRLLGAVTFVSDQDGRRYSPEEIRLAQSLANRNAEALEHARIYTEAHRAREQAELATLNKLRFLGNISHELRSPINAIIGYVELIAEEIHGPVTPAQREDLVRIRLNQQHLLGLVNDLLTFVQAGSPRMNEIVGLSVDRAVKRAITLIENTLSRKSIRYEHVTSDPDLLALGDQERVSQILVNLLANAVKFTGRGGSITTRCEATESQVHIRVIDTGIGIDASRLAEIFEPFIQVDGGHSGEVGVGLGLAISRDLARTMHGDISVESTRGEGSCFTLTLPRAPAEAPA
jgi:signal transduction histidine kinase